MSLYIRSPCCNRGVTILQDLYIDHGLRGFNDRQAEFNLPGSSFSSSSLYIRGLF